MIFRGRKLSELTEQDLQRLVDDSVQESESVEYKSSMYGNSDEEKREFLKDVTSMANQRGGYLVIGVEEDDDGTARRISGIPKDNSVERLHSMCLDNIEKKILGLMIEDVDLTSGDVVIVIQVPQSLNAPHMVTYRGLNQFWTRHGRQKAKMTVDEIGQAFDKRLSHLNRLERFLFGRKAELLETIGEGTFMVMSATPAYLTGEAVFDINDIKLRSAIANPPLAAGGYGISCGQPYPTINGLKADDRYSLASKQSGLSLDRFIEVFRNGHVEFGVRMKPSDNPNLGVYFAAVADAEYVVNFVALLTAIFEKYLPMTPLSVGFAIYNAKGMCLVSSQYLEGSAWKWASQHLELGDFYVDSLSEEGSTLAKRICDRLWQAFHRDKATVFDDSGRLIRRR